MNENDVHVILSEGHKHSGKEENPSVPISEPKTFPVLQ